MRARRSIFLINKKFQLRFSFFVCSWLFALSFVYPLIIHNLYEFFFRYLSVDPNGPQLMALQTTRKEMLVLLLMLQVVFVAISFLISIFVSHRIAGPLYKLSLFMKDAKQGTFNHLKFREKDNFKDLAEDFNAMIGEIQAAKENSAESAAAAIVHIEKALSQTEDAALKKELTEAVNTLRQI